MFYRFLSSRDELDEKTDSTDIYINSNSTDINFVKTTLGDKKLNSVSGYEIVAFCYKVGNNIPNTDIGISKNINGGSDGSANYIVTFPAGFYSQSEFITQLQNTLLSRDVGNPINISLDVDTNKITMTCINPVNIYSAGGWSQNFMQLLGTNKTDLINQYTSYTFPLPSISITSSDLRVVPSFGESVGITTTKFTYKFTKLGNYENVDIYKSRIINFANRVSINTIDVFLNIDGDPNAALAIPDWNITIRFYA